MVRMQSLATLSMGIVFGAVGCWALLGSTRPVFAANDRHEEFVICTGAAGITPRSGLDGVWMFDSKRGKLYSTIMDRSIGKTVGFAELDVVKEFGLGTANSVHFVMTTGHIAAGQAALYLVETNSGKMGVYTLGPSSDGNSGVTIMRHDMTNFRGPKG